MRAMKLAVIGAAVVAGAAAGPATAQRSLMCTLDTHGFGFNYGGSRYGNFSAEIDGYFGTVTTVTDLSDLSAMNQYDSIMVQIREWGATLSPTEQANLDAYVASGRRVLLIGENPSLWFEWNDDICNVGGGSSTNSESNGSYTVLNAHPVLTAGVTSIHIPNGGIANGGTSLFTTNTATLWDGNGQENVLTMLDVNVFENDRWATEDGAQYSANVATWLGYGGGLGLSFRGDCPGQMTFSISGATPSRAVAVVYGAGDGPTTVPGGFPCAGTMLEVGGPGLAYQQFTADASGNVTVTTNVPAGACGSLRIQALDVASCATSNVVRP